MDTLSKLFGRAALVLLVLVAATVARAQTIEFTSAPSTMGMNTNTELWIRANLPSGVYTNLAVEMKLPSTVTHPTVVFVNATGNPDFSLSNTVTAGVRTLRWTRAGTLDLSGGASTRQFLAIVYADRIGTFDETPLTFTATLDGSSGGVPFSQSQAQHTITAQRTAAFNFYGSSASYVNVVNPTVADGSPERYGIKRTLIFSMGNVAKDYLAPTTATLTIGRKLRFLAVRTIRSSQTVLANPIVTGAPAPWSTNASAYSFDVTTAQPPWDGNVDRIAFEVDVFIPCSDMPTAAPYGDYEGSAFITGTTRDFYGVETSQSGTVANIRVNDAAAACGALGYFTHNSVSVGNSGETAAWYYSYYAPYGITDQADLMVALRLPPDLVSFNPGSFLATGGWTREHCDMTGLTFAAGAQFSYAELMTYRASRCHAAFAPGDTHVAYWKASYSESDPQSLSGWVSTGVAPDRVATHGTTLTMNGWFNARSTTNLVMTFGDQIPEVNPVEDRFESTATAQLPTTLVPVSTHFYDGPGVLDSNGGAAGSSHIRPRMSWSGYPPTNSRLTVEVPDGVTISSFNFDNSVSPVECNVPADKMVWPSPNDRPLVFRFGTASNPYTQPGTCAGGAAIRINFAVDPTFPFFHEQALPFRTSHIADNQTAAGAVYTATFQVIVAAGQDSRLTVVCDEGGDPAFTALAVNRGRDPIADGVLRFVVPEDTTVTSITPNAAVAGSGGVIEVSTDGGSTWLADTGSYAGVTHVRLAGIAIAGGSASNLPPQPGFTVTVSPLFGLGTIEGEVTMSSPGLGTTTPKIAPFEVGLCPGSVEVQVYFDADGDGIQDVGEPAVGAGHQVKLVPQAGSPSGFETDVATTGLGGSVTFEGVTPGSYDIVYVGPPATVGQWSVTHASVITLANDGTTNGLLGLGCGCVDPSPGNVCSGAECNAAGACITTWAELDSPCDDGVADGECIQDVCQSEGFCGPMPLAFGTTCTNPDPENVCYDGGQCDGDGACEPVYVADGTLCDDPTPDDPCTVGRCDAGACLGADADDGTACTLEDLCVDAAECQGGSCTSTGETDCDDADDCTVDSCDSADGCVNEEPACDAVAIAIPLADAQTGAAAGHVRCYITPSPTGGPGTLTCDSGSGVLVRHEGAGVCGSP